MRSEYAANVALQPPTVRHYKQTARVALPPPRRTLWGVVFFWL